MIAVFDITVSTRHMHLDDWIRRRMPWSPNVYSHERRERVYGDFCSVAVRYGSTTISRYGSARNVAFVDLDAGFSALSRWVDDRLDEVRGEALARVRWLFAHSFFPIRVDDEPLDLEATG